MLAHDFEAQFFSDRPIENDFGCAAVEQEVNAALPDLNADDDRSPYDACRESNGFPAGRKLDEDAAVRGYRNVPLADWCCEIVADEEVVPIVVRSLVAAVDVASERPPGGVGDKVFVDPI